MNIPISQTTGTHRDQTSQLFFKLSTVLIVVCFAVVSGIHWFEHKIDINILKGREKTRIQLGTATVRKDFWAVTSDLRYLNSSGYLGQYIQTSNAANRNALAKDALSLVSVKGLYDQLRVLDTSGDEMVRINFNAGNPNVVPDPQLQNKRGRYYFDETLSMECGQIYVSPLDLNIEHGEIELPFKPMIRFGMPICDSAGEKKGIILFNYLGSELLDNLRNTLSKDQDLSSPTLLNENGYWLLSPSVEDEWGFMFGQDNRFQNRYPDAWKKIQKMKCGQFESPRGIFTFHTLAPLDEGQCALHESPTSAPHTRKPPHGNTEKWVLLLHVSNSAITDRARSHIPRGALRFLLVMLVLLPLTWFYCKEKNRAACAARDLKNSAEFTRSVAAQLGEGLMVLDRRGKLITMNPEAERLLGWRESELIHGCIAHLFPSGSVSKTLCQQPHLPICESAERLEPVNITRKDGHEIPISLARAPMLSHGEVDGSILTFRDISERLEVEKQLKILATHDALTGAKNRGELERLLAEELDRCKRYSRIFSILLLDIDHFKNINDTYGHQVGDEVLKALCVHTSDFLRTSDTLGRYGGEEFMVILPETDIDGAEVFAKRLHTTLGAMDVALPEGEGTISCTVSIGVATYPQHGVSVDSITQKADKALYKAKEEGRDRVMTAA